MSNHSNCGDMCFGFHAHPLQQRLLFENQLPKFQTSSLPVLTLLFVEAELASERKRLDVEKRRLELDRRKLDSHKQDLFNKPPSRAPTTTTTTTTITTRRLATTVPTPLTALPCVDDTPCSGRWSTHGCAERVLPSRAIGASTMAAVLAPASARVARSLNILIATFELAGGPRRVGGIGTAYAQLAMALAAAGTDYFFFFVPSSVLDARQATK